MKKLKFFIAFLCTVFATNTFAYHSTVDLILENHKGEPYIQWAYFDDGTHRGYFAFDLITGGMEDWKIERLVDGVWVDESFLLIYLREYESDLTINPDGTRTYYFKGLVEMADYAFTIEMTTEDTPPN